MNSTDLITLVVFAGTLTCVVAVVIAMSGGAAMRQSKRVALIRHRWSGSMLSGGSTESLLHNSSESRLGSIALRFMPRRHMLRERLIKAGLKLTPGRYALVCLVLALIAGLGVKFLLAASVMIAVLTAIVIGLGLPHFYCSRRINRRITKFTKLFPEAIDLMVRGIKSGLPISETISAIGQEMEDPIGPEFQRVMDSVKIGQTLEEALWEAARRIDTADFKFFIISLSVQRETGGNLGETLENLSEVLRKRSQMKLKIKAMSSEARASAYIIGSLPFVIFGILLLMNPDYIMVLFTDPRGLIVLGVGMTMMALGSLVMAKMVRFEI